MTTALPSPAVPSSERVKLVACAAVIDAMATSMPPQMPRETLDFGFHDRPAGLTEQLQAVIDRSPDLDTIVLGYGLCSMAVLGLRATHCRLVLPNVHDCISLFLGSREAAAARAREEPGTYYLTRSWIEAGGSPLQEAERLADRHGPPKAERMMRLMYQGYSRLAYIGLGEPDGSAWHAHALATAERLGLRYQEIPGSTALMHKLINGPWDEECVVVDAGDSVRLEHFSGPGAPLAEPNRG